MDNLSNNLDCDLTEEELRKLLDDLPTILIELEIWVATEGKVNSSQKRIKD